MTAEVARVKGAFEAFKLQQCTWCGGFGHADGACKTRERIYAMIGENDFTKTILNRAHELVLNDRHQARMAQEPL